MESICRAQKEHTLHGEGLCKTEDIASRTFYRPDRQRAACHLTGELTLLKQQSAEHNHGSGFSLPFCCQNLRDIPNTSPAWTVPRPYVLRNKVLFHRTLTAVKSGLVDRVWTFANPSFLLRAINRTSLIYCPVGRRWDLHRRTVPASV